MLDEHLKYMLEHKGLHAMADALYGTSVKPPKVNSARKTVTDPTFSPITNKVSNMIVK